MRLGGQLRIAPNGAVLGYDMTAALALAEALGVERAAAAEFLPEAEGAMIAALKDQTESGNHER